MPDSNNANDMVQNCSSANSLHGSCSNASPLPRKSSGEGDMQLPKPLLAVFSNRSPVEWSCGQDTEPTGNAALSLQGCGWPSPPDHRCALVPLHCHSCTRVPLAGLAALTSRQLPSRLCTV